MNKRKLNKDMTLSQSNMTQASVLKLRKTHKQSRGQMPFNATRDKVASAYTLKGENEK